MSNLEGAGDRSTREPGSVLSRRNVDHTKMSKLPRQSSPQAGSHGRSGNGYYTNGWSAVKGRRDQLQESTGESEFILDSGGMFDISFHDESE